MSNSLPDTDTALVRPAVNVRIPEVKLQLKDLAYLRSVSQPKSLRCHPGSTVIDRLRFLDLIARANVPPSPETVMEVRKKTAELLPKLKAAIKKQDWHEANNLTYSLQREKDRLKPSEDDVLTERGKTLLSQGETTVKVRKVGCV